MKKLVRELALEKPLFAICLGLCPALAVIKTFEEGYLMGLFVFLIFFLSNVVIALISKLMKKQISILIVMIIIAIFATILDLIVGTYLEPLSTSLGVYIPIIVISCIVLGMNVSDASNQSIRSTIIDTLRIGLGYILSLTLISLIIELIGKNTITIMDKISGLTGYIIKYQIFDTNDIIPNSLFLTSAGAFLIIGLILGIINALRKDDTK